MNKESSKDVGCPVPPDPTPAINSFINRIFLEAISKGAVAVHIEPQKTPEGTRSQGKLFVAGQLRDSDTAFPSEGFHVGVVVRLKILANLNIAERVQSQEGILQFIHNGHLFDIEVCTRPGSLGEALVLRLSERFFLGSSTNS